MAGKMMQSKAKARTTKQTNDAPKTTQISAPAVQKAEEPKRNSTRPNFLGSIMYGNFDSTLATLEKTSPEEKLEFAQDKSCLATIFKNKDSANKAAVLEILVNVLIENSVSLKEYFEEAIKAGTASDLLSAIKHMSDEEIMDIAENQSYADKIDKLADSDQKTELLAAIQDAANASSEPVKQAIRESIVNGGEGLDVMIEGLSNPQRLAIASDHEILLAIMGVKSDNVRNKSIALLSDQIKKTSTAIAAYDKANSGSFYDKNYSTNLLNSLNDAREEDMAIIADNHEYFKNIVKTQNAERKQLIEKFLTALNSKYSEYKSILQKALNDNEIDTIQEMVKNSTPSQLTVLGSDETMLHQIINLDSKISHPILDALHNHIMNAELLKDAVDARFHVKLGTARIEDAEDLKHAKQFLETVSKSNSQYLHDGGKKGVEQEWTEGGIQRLYSVYLNVPQGHLDKVKAVITTNSIDGGGGLSQYWDGIYLANSSVSNLDNISDYISNNEKGGFISSKEDKRYGLVEADMTVVHELGHVVDYQLGIMSGKRFSEREDFRALSGWQEHGGGNEKVEKAIANSVENPYPENFKDKTSTEIIDKIGVKMLSDSASDDSKRESAIKNVLNEKKTKKKLKKENIDSEEFEKAAKESDLLKHIQRGFYTNNPFLHETFGGMKRQIHQNYGNRSTWVSYNTSAMDDKVSRYEFSNPAEEFAELYASYYITGDGKRTPARLKEWFVNNVVKNPNAKKLDPNGQSPDASHDASLK